jgi:hypothetical protein
MRASLFIFLICFNARAEFFKGPVSSALGGTGRAGLSSSEGAFLNPAVIPLIKNYEFIGFYRDGEIAEGQHRQGWAVGVVDNSEDVLFPGAAHYGKIRDTGRSPAGVNGKGVNGEIWHAAGAYLFHDRLSLGFSAYRLQYKSKGDRSYTQWSGSLGLVALVNDLISVAYVYDNVARPGSETPLGLREDPKHSIGFFGRIADLMTVRADIQREVEFNPDGRMAYMVGIETITSEWFLARFGYRLDDLRNQRFATAGFGFNGPRLKVDYAFEKNIEGSSGALHSVDLRVPF